MAAESLESVALKIIKAIRDLRKLQSNTTQSIKGIADNFNDTPDNTIPVSILWKEKTETDNQLLPVSDQVLFSVQFLKYLEKVITQLLALITLANDYSRRNNEADTDVDTFDTTSIRLFFLSLAQQHMMCTQGISFSSNGPKMSKFREQFLKQFLKDAAVAENDEKEASGQATTYVGGDTNKKTFDTTLEALTQSDYSRPATSSLASIIKTQNQEARWTPTDATAEFETSVQTSALLVTTTAITGKGADGDKKMKKYFYDFIEVLLGATKAQALKTELAGMFERQPLPCHPIIAPHAEIADQLTWPNEVLRKAEDQFTHQKTVRVLEVTLEGTTPREVLKPTHLTVEKVPKPALEGATPQKPLQHTRPTGETVLGDVSLHPTEPTGERTTGSRPITGRATKSASVLSPTSPIPTPPMLTQPVRAPLHRLAPIAVVSTPIKKSHIRVPLAAHNPIKVGPDV
ncbi:hypothetical protein T484DRAFT_1756445 [Baffinella frigidus]|nr:hypothetical protein T484DRAFT_1756445 [Cryptophyta sp. CCMP2293]